MKTGLIQPLWLALTALLLSTVAALGAPVEFRLVAYDDPTVTVNKKEYQREITNPVTTERGVVIQTIGIDYSGWARNVLLDQQPLFERYHEGKYIDRLPIARRELKPGDHVLWPGDHTFTLAEDGTLSTTDPELIIQDGAVLLKMYPVTISALRANPPEGDVPDSMRLAPLPNATLREAANHESTLKDPETGKSRGGKALELLPIFEDFAPLTLWLPANTVGKGYWLHPIGMTFHLTKDGVAAGAGDGATVDGVTVKGSSLTVPLFQYPVKGDVNSSLVAEGVEKLSFNKGDTYTKWFPKATDYALRVAASGPSLNLEGPLKTFPEKAFAVEQYDPSKGLSRLLALEMTSRHLTPGATVRLRIRGLDAAPATLAESAVKTANNAIKQAKEAQKAKEPVADADALLKAAEAALAKAQSDLDAVQTTNLLADTAAFVELQAYGSESWTAVKLAAADAGQVDITVPKLADGVYRLRAGLRKDGYTPLFVDTWVTLAGKQGYSAGLFTPRGRTAFLRGEAFWLGLGLMKVSAPIPAGTPLKVSLVDEQGVRLPLLESRTTAEVGSRETIIIRLTQESSLQLAAGRYQVEAQVGNYTLHPLAMELVEADPETHFINMMNGKYSPQNKIYEQILKTGVNVDLLAADLANTGYNSFMGMSYDVNRVARNNLDLEQLVRERPELGPWETFYQPSHRDAFMDACVRHGIQFWENAIPYHDTMLPRNSDIIQATERFVTLETQSMATSPAFQGVCMYDEIYFQAQQGIPEELYRSFAEWAEMKYREKNPGLTTERALKALDRFATLPAGQRQQKDAEIYRTVPNFEDSLWADFSLIGARGAKRAMPSGRNFHLQRYMGSNGGNIFVSGTATGVSKPFEIAATVMYKDGGAGDRPVFAPMQADVLRTRDDITVTTQLHSFSDSGAYGNHVLRQAFFALSQKVEGFTFFTLPHSAVNPSPTDWHDSIGDITKRLTTPYGDLFMASKKGYGKVGIYASRMTDVLSSRKPVDPKTACEGLWVACARAGYPADIIYDDQVLAGRANDFDVLFFPGVYFEEELPAEVLKQLQAFINAGKLLIVERGSKLPLDGIVRADSTFDEYDPKDGAFPRYVDFETEMVFDRSEETTQMVRALLQSKKVPPAAVHDQLVGPDWLRCRDGEYLLMPNFAPTKWTGLYKTRYQAPNLATLRFPKRPGACYDVLAMKEHPVNVDGDWMETQVDMRHVPGAFLAFLPAPIASVSLKVSASPKAGTTLQYTASVADAAGKTIDAGIPIEISLLDPKGKQTYRIYRAATPEYAGAYALPLNPVAGNWTLQVRELFSGRISTSTFALKPASGTVATVDDRTVWLDRKAAVQAFLKTEQTINVAVDQEQEWVRPLAARLVEQLAARGVKAQVVAVDQVLRLPQPWDRLNPLIDGSRLWRGNLVEPGLFVDAPTIVMGRRNENRLIEALQRRDLMPTLVSEQFPGPGRAAIQYLPLAFSNDFDTVALLANDAAGLDAGIKALCSPDTQPDGYSVHPSGAAPTAQPTLATVAGTKAGPSTADSFQASVSQEVPVASISVDPKTGRILCGTRGYGDNIFCLDRDGKLLWQTYLPEFNVYHAEWFDGGKKVVAATGRGFYAFLMDGETGKVLTKFAATEYPRFHGYWTIGGEGAVNTTTHIQVNDAERQILIGGETGIMAVSFEGKKMWFRDLAEAIASIPAEVEISGGAGTYQRSAGSGPFVLSPDGKRAAISEYYKIATTVVNTQLTDVWAHYPVVVDTKTGDVLWRNTEDPGNQTSRTGWSMTWKEGFNMPTIHTGDLTAEVTSDGTFGPFEFRAGNLLKNGTQLESTPTETVCKRIDDTTVWSTPMGTLWMTATDVMSADQKLLYRQRRDGLLRCLDLSDGAIKWEMQLPFVAKVEPVSDGVIAGCTNGEVYRLNGAGKPVWKLDLRTTQELQGTDYAAFVRAGLLRDVDHTGEFFPVSQDTPGDLDKVLRLGLEQLDNGDFETDDAWKAGDAKPTYSAPAQSGARSLHLADAQLVTQTPSRRIVPSATYLLEFYFRVTSSETRLTAGALLHSGADETFTGSRYDGQPGDWTFARLAIKTPANIDTLDIGFEAAGGEVWVDHVTLRPVRFPSANLLANEELHRIEPTFVKDFRVSYSRVSAELKRSLMGKSHVVAFKQGGTNTAPTLFQEEAFLHNGRLDDVGERWTYVPDNMGFSAVLGQTGYISHLVLYFNNATPDNTYSFISIVANDMETKREKLVKLVRGNNRRFLVVEFDPVLQTDSLKILPGMHRGGKENLTEVELYGPLGGPELAGKGKAFADDPNATPMYMASPTHVRATLPPDLTGEYVMAPAFRLWGDPPYFSDCTVVNGSVTATMPSGIVQELLLPGYGDEKAKKQNKVTNGMKWDLGSITPTTTPLRYAGRLIAGTADGRMHAVADNGVYLWNFSTGGRVYSSPVAQGDDVYFGSDDGKLYKVDVDSGILIWEFATGGKIRGAPALWERTLVVPSWDGKLYAVQADSGKPLWSSDIALYTRGSPAVKDGKVYLGDEDGTLHCFDVLTGKPIWATKLEGRFSGCPVVTPVGILVAADRGGLHWVGLDGKVKWQATLPARLSGQPMATATQVLVPHEGGLAVLRQSDGKADPRVTLPEFGEPVQSMALYGGKLFVLGGGVRIDKSNGQSFTIQDVKPMLWEPKAETDK